MGYLQKILTPQLSAKRNNLCTKINFINKKIWNVFLKNCFFFLFRATLMAYGSFQAGGLIWSYSCWPRPQLQQHQIQATSAAYTTAHRNTRSLTHWVGSGMEPTSSWMLVGFIITEPKGNSLKYFYNLHFPSKPHIKTLKEHTMKMHHNTEKKE